MIRLLLVDIDAVGTHHKQSLRELNVMDEANQLVLAVTEDAAEVEYAKDRKDPLNKEGEYSHAHQARANVQVVLLDLLQLVGELGLLLHVASLLFTATVAHLLPSIIHVILIHRVIVPEHTHILRGIAVAVIARLMALCLPAPRSTLIRVLGIVLNLRRALPRRVVTITGEAGLVNHVSRCRS